MTVPSAAVHAGPLGNATGRIQERKRTISSIQFPYQEPLSPVMKRHKFVIVKKERFSAREKHSFSANHTIARCVVDVMNREEYKDRIEDHAYRRVLIFYYQLLIYYREGLQIELDATTHQYGVAREEGHHAAHSSILPNLKDDCAPARLLPSYTHFYRIMNATVEVEKEVNVFDAFIETAMRKPALEILNRVSQENLHPYEGLNQFVNEVREFFLESESQILQKLELISMLLCAGKKSSEQEARFKKNGTLKGFVPFCNGLLSVNELQLKLFSFSSFSPAPPSLLAQKEILRMIETVIGKEMRKIEKETNFVRLKAYARRLEKLLLTEERYGNVPFQMLKQAQCARTRSKTVSLLQQFFQECSQGDLYIALGGDVEKILKTLREQEQRLPSSLEDYREKLLHMLDILKMQQKGTSLPPFEVLSGKIKGNRLVGLEEEELMEQKRKILLSL